jgi:predicted amidophosphoribosyltransferase
MTISRPNARRKHRPEKFKPTVLPLIRVPLDAPDEPPCCSECGYELEWLNRYTLACPGCGRHYPKGC